MTSCCHVEPRPIPAARLPLPRPATFRKPDRELVLIVLPDGTTVTALAQWPLETIAENEIERLREIEELRAAPWWEGAAPISH